MFAKREAFILPRRSYEKSPQVTGTFPTQYQHFWLLRSDRHRFGKNSSNLFRRINKMPVGEVGINRRCAVPLVSEQPADNRQVLAGHDSMAGHAVAKVMEPQPAERRILAERPPASSKTVLAPAFGVARKQGRIGAPPAGERVDMRPDTQSAASDTDWSDRWA